MLSQVDGKRDSGQQNKPSPALTKGGLGGFSNGHVPWRIPPGVDTYIGIPNIRHRTSPFSLPSFLQPLSGED